MTDGPGGGPSAVLAALSGPRLFDVVLAATALEAVLLLLFGRRLGLAPGRWAPFLGAGVGLAVAGRLATMGAAVPLAGAALLLSFAFHAWHLARLRRVRPGDSNGQ